MDIRRLISSIERLGDAILNSHVRIKCIQTRHQGNLGAQGLHPMLVN